MNSNLLWITRLVTILILIYGLESIKATQIGPGGEGPNKSRSKRDIPINYRSSFLKWAGLGKRDDHTYDNYEIDDSQGYYSNNNGGDAKDGRQWSETGDTKLYFTGSEIKRSPNTPFKWTGLGKRSASSGGEIILSSPQNKLQSRSSSSLKWMGLGKRGSSASLKWVGLGKKSLFNDESLDRSRRSPNRRDMSALKWAGLGKRNTYYDLDNLYYTAENLPKDKRGASSQFRWVGLGKRRFYNVDQNGFIVDKKEKIPLYYDGGDMRAWYNAYMSDNPLHKVVATKKLNPIYQWSGLGKKK